MAHGDSAVAQAGPSAAARMLGAWEASLAATGPRRTLLLLEQAAGIDRNRLAAMPVGRGDALLLDLREHAFGTRMDCEADCPACGERLEFTLDTGAVRVPADAASAAAEHQVEHGGRSVRFRLPTLGDLDACAGAGDERAAAHALLAHCLVEPAAAAPDGALAAAVSERIGVLDPQAVTTIAMTCPACAHGWDTLFDIGAFVAREIDSWAPRTLEQVHLLASHYGWSEHDILALTPARRRHYVERLGG